MQKCEGEKEKERERKKERKAMRYVDTQKLKV